MDERVQAFLKQNRAAAMITLRADGTPHVARVGIALIDGKLWSSGTRRRVRTKHLRRDPRSTLFVFDQQFRWLGLETTVTIIDGPDVPQLSLRFFRLLQQELDPPPPPGHVMWFGQPKTEEEFLKLIVEERRIIYGFAIQRAYGMY
jgi:PPOX class probable F420-dependent enzyme